MPSRLTRVRRSRRCSPPSSWYLVAEQDRMIAADTQHFMAERMKARVRAHPVDHTPSVTAPEAVLDIVREAVREAVHG